MSVLTMFVNSMPPLRNDKKASIFLFGTLIFMKVLIIAFSCSEKNRCDRSNFDRSGLSSLWLWSRFNLVTVQTSLTKVMTISAWQFVLFMTLVFLFLAAGTGAPSSIMSGNFFLLLANLLTCTPERFSFSASGHSSKHLPLLLHLKVILVTMPIFCLSLECNFHI